MTESLITQPGIYTISDAAYHADPCPEASVSRSFLTELLNTNPAKARIKHPRLNPEYEANNDRDFDLGKAVHDYFLSGGAKVQVLDFPHYRSDAAKECREIALRNGKLPILREKFEKVEKISLALQRQILLHNEHSDGFKNGKPEQTIVWKEDDVWCRSRPDFLQGNDGWIDDLKTTEINTPGQWGRGIVIDAGYDLQAYMDMRGYEKVTGKKCKGVRLFIVETNAPYCMYVAMFHAEVLNRAAGEFEIGIQRFRQCRDANVWPGYPNSTLIIMPGYKSDSRAMSVDEANIAVETGGGVVKALLGGV